MTLPQSEISNAQLNYSFLEKQLSSSFSTALLPSLLEAKRQIEFETLVLTLLESILPTSRNCIVGRQVRRQKAFDTVPDCLTARILASKSSWTETVTGFRWKSGHVPRQHAESFPDGSAGWTVRT